MTDPDKMQVVLENPLILIHETPLRSLPTCCPSLEKVAQAGQPPDRGRGCRRRGAGRARGQQAARHAEGRGRESAGHGDRRKAMLEDIAVLTGMGD